MATPKINVPSSLHHKQGHFEPRVGALQISIIIMRGKKCQTRHKPTFFCFSLVKSEPTWLRPEELKFEAKKEEEKNEAFLYLNIDRKNQTKHASENVRPVYFQFHANNLPSTEQVAKTRAVFFFYFASFLAVYLLFECCFVA